MVKVKNKKNSGLADKVRNKRRVEATKKVLNPFEVHVNREKFKVLGRKPKHDRGLPGVSRAKAIQKRKETIGTEMKLMNKTNSFVDRRIGEKDSRMTGEEKVLARFAAEQAKKHTKRDIYNLADDVLTHRGQTLEEIEKFDDPRSSDEEDEDGRKFGGLNDDFVAEGHFGGGILSKTDTRDGAKSHKDLIEQLIAESKKRKAEKQKLKEQTLDMTEKLDTEWKDLQPIVFKRPRVEEKPQEESAIDKLLIKETKRAEDYDKMMRELIFEKRGTPSDGLQSEEKLAKQEKERLDKLEKEREERMRGVVHTNVNTAAYKHRSADDLDDNFDLDTEPNYMVSYDKDGKLLMPENIATDHSLKKKKVVFDNEISDSNDEEEKESEAEESEEDDRADSIAVQASSVADNTDNMNAGEENKRTIDSEQSEEEESDGQNDSSGEEEESESEEKEDKLDTEIYKMEIDDSDEEIHVTKKAKLITTLKETKEKRKKTDTQTKQTHTQTKQTDTRTKSDNEEPIRTYGDLGENVFDLAEASSDDLIDTLSEKTPEVKSVFLDRLIKRYHPSLAEENKDLLSKLFAYLLQYINDIFTNLSRENQILQSFRIFDKIAPQMYDLAQHNVMNAKHCLTEVVAEKYQDYKKRQKTVPDLDTLIFFKLVSLIFPTSDFRHPVVTPCLVFMSEILTKCKFNSTYSIARGLFVTALILEYTVLSKRFVPSAINFVRGILFLSANVSVLNPIQVVPPFKLYSKEARMLVLEGNCTGMASQNKMAAKDLIIDDVTDEFRVRCLSSTVAMLREMFTNCNEMETQQCMFEPHIQLLGRVDLNLYPTKIAADVNETASYMKETLEMKTYVPLAREKKRPKALKLYEPDVQDVFTGSKSSKLSREQAERDKLKHRLKRETKGALREIRRDKAYIAAVNIKRKIESDNIRKGKVKQIYKEASIQQGELNKLKRTK